MADIFLFMQHGWKNIWKQNTIWVFSILPFLNQLFIAFQTKPASNLPWSILLLVGSFISLILLFVSYTGVPYIEYNFSIGKSVTIQETLSATRRFSGKILGCSCLGILILSPWIILAFATSIKNPTKLTLLLQPLSLVSAVWYFSMFGFFANDWGIRQTLKHAWLIFTAHFNVLATLGIIMTIILKICSVASGILTVLIQSGFNATSLNTLNYINPSISLSKNVLFVLLNGIGQTIFTIFSVSVFALAYLKYTAGQKQSTNHQHNV